MGRSSASCFKIITCGSDSVDHDDLETAQSKGSSDRRGWSFRKRPARHRVLSNTAISEATSTVNKESPESTGLNSQVQPDLTVPEKTSVIQWTEENNELSAEQDAKLPDTTVAGEEDAKADALLNESSIVTIQAAIRGFLAQRALLEQKNVIKLQAAVRGHLVRRHAVGTLRCVQAIIKMQALVRARRSCLHVEGTGNPAKKNESSGKDDLDSTLQSSKEVKPNGRYSYVSVEKLLSNGFARQLMESTPRNTPINIKCDPLKSDSAWKWLERWMSVSYVSNEEPRDSRSATDHHGKEHLGHSDGKDTIVPSVNYSESTYFKPGADASVEASENNDCLITYHSANLELQACKSISPSSSHSELQNIDELDSPSDATESAPPNVKHTDLTPEVEAKPLPEEEETGETGNEQDVPDSVKLSPEQPETEAKKFSRQASNPTFIAAQSKFEELSSYSTSAKLTRTSSHDLGVESSLDKCSSTDQPIRSRDIRFFEHSVSSVQIGGSECGTELSISSTLDSPVRSEAGVNEQEKKISNEINHARNRENLEPEVDEKSIILETDTNSSKLQRDESINSAAGESVNSMTAEVKAPLEKKPEADPSDLQVEAGYIILETDTNSNKLERYESINSATGESVSSMTAEDKAPLEKKPEADPSDLQVEAGSEACHQLYKSSSPEAASPRSHITVPESSQATPSSQVSVKPKKSRGEKSEANSKSSKSSSSADKKSNSALRNSTEQLHKEHKTGKRRSSIGSAAKPTEQRDQEPRDSSSSSSLPSYMQATESARAKAISANASPRSSPDAHEKDVYIKKRHSLSGANERQGSPSIQRSLSQAQQNAKGNGNQSPQDRKWRR